MIKFDEVKAVMQENEELFDFTGGVSEDRIASAEEYLGVLFPESYKYFLKKYGTAERDRLEGYGIL